MWLLPFLRVGLGWYSYTVCDIAEFKDTYSLLTYCKLYHLPRKVLQQEVVSLIFYELTRQIFLLKNQPGSLRASLYTEQNTRMFYCNSLTSYSCNHHQWYLVNNTTGGSAVDFCILNKIILKFNNILCLLMYLPYELITLVKLSAGDIVQRMFSIIKLNCMPVATNIAASNETRDGCMTPAWL